MTLKKSCIVRRLHCSLLCPTIGHNSIYFFANVREREFISQINVECVLVLFVC